MKTTRFRIPLLVAATLLLLAMNCDPPPDPTELPPATAEGLNTFGCLINGRLFTHQYRRVYFGGYESTVYLSPSGDFDTLTRESRRMRVVCSNRESDEVPSRRVSISVPWPPEINRPYRMLGFRSDEVSGDVELPDSTRRRCRYHTRPGHDYAQVIIRRAVRLWDTVRRDTGQPQIVSRGIILAGEFRFSASDSLCGVVQVTEGRFDVHTR